MALPDFLLRLRPRSATFAANAAGTTAIVFAIALPVLLTAAGTAMETIRLYNARDDLQELADATALAGTSALGDNYSKRDREALALAAAAKFFDAKAPAGATRTIAMRKDGTGVVVDAGDKVRFAFGGILNLEEADVGVHSDGVMRPGFPVCLLALDSAASVGIEIGGSGNVDAPDCIFWSNSTRPGSVTSSGSGDLVNRHTCAVGGYVRGGASRVTPTPQTGCIDYKDPFAATAFPSGAGCTQRNHVVDTKGTAVVHPGTYCGGLTVKADNVVLKPGVFVIKDGPLVVSSGTDITGADVSIFLTGIGTKVAMNGHGILKLSAPATGPMEGIALARDRKDVSLDISVLTGGSKVVIDGALYFPTQRIELTGNGLIEVSARASIVAKTIKTWGSGHLVFQRNPRLAGKQFLFYEGVRLDR